MAARQAPSGRPPDMTSVCVGLGNSPQKAILLDAQLLASERGLKQRIRSSRPFQSGKIQWQVNSAKAASSLSICDGVIMIICHS